MGNESETGNQSLFFVTESMFSYVIYGPLKGPLFFFNGLTSTLKFPVKTANTAWNQVSIRCSNAFAANILQPATLAPPHLPMIIVFETGAAKAHHVDTPLPPARENGPVISPL